MGKIAISQPVDLRVDTATGLFIVVEKGGKSPLLRDGKPVMFDPAKDSLVFTSDFSAANRGRPIDITLFKGSGATPVPMNGPGDIRPPFIRVENAADAPLALGGAGSYLVDRGAFVRVVDPSTFARVSYNSDGTFIRGTPPTLIQESDEPHMGFPAGTRVIQYPPAPGKSVMHNDAVGTDGVLLFARKTPSGPDPIYALKMDDVDAARKRLNGAVDLAKGWARDAKAADAAAAPAGKPKPKIPKYNEYPAAEKADPFTETEKALVRKSTLGLAMPLPGALHLDSRMNSTETAMNAPFVPGSTPFTGVTGATKFKS